MGLYKYEPLNTSEACIRLFRLYKGEYGDRIDCSVFETAATAEEGSMAAIPYEALSYTWRLPVGHSSGSEDSVFETRELPRLPGHEGNEWQVYIDNESLAVTENLYDALQSLRYEHRDRIIWIDAICIDQSSEQERSHQVPLMKRIYEHAEEVIIWLGTCLPQAEAAMELWSKYLELGGTSPQQITIDVYLNKREALTGEPVDHISQRLHKGFGSILASEWFDRVWVIQEVAFARTASVICGSTSLSSKQLLKAVDMLGIPATEHCQAIMDVMPSRRRQQQSWWQHDRSLWKILNQFKAAKATDEKDRIFALLGLTNMSERQISDFINYGRVDAEILSATMACCFPEFAAIGASQPLTEWPISTFLMDIEKVQNILCWENPIMQEDYGCSTSHILCQYHRFTTERNLVTKVFDKIIGTSIPPLPSIQERWESQNKMYELVCPTILHLIFATGKVDSYVDSKRMLLSGTEIMVRIKKQICHMVMASTTTELKERAKDLLQRAILEGFGLLVAELFKIDFIADSLRKSPHGSIGLENSWVESTFGSVSSNGHFDCVKQLIALQMLDIRHVDKYGFTPLSLAVEEGWTEVVEALLETSKGRETVLYTHPRRGTCLNIAIGVASPRAVKALLETQEGLRAITMENPFRRSALPLAATYSSYERTKQHAKRPKQQVKQAKQQAKQAKQNKQANRPEQSKQVKQASRPEQSKQVKQASRPEQSKQAKQASRPEQSKQVKQASRPEHSKQLKQPKQPKRPEQTKKAKQVKRPELSESYVEIVETILEKAEGRSALTIKDENGKTPLHFAVVGQNQELARRMTEIILRTREGRSMITMKDNGGITPLRLAVQKGYIELIDLIMTTREGQGALTGHAVKRYFTTMAPHEHRAAVEKALSTAMAPDKRRAAVKKAFLPPSLPTARKVYYELESGSARSIDDVLEDEVGLVQ